MNFPWKWTGCRIYLITISDVLQHFLFSAIIGFEIQFLYIQSIWIGLMFSLSHRVISYDGYFNSITLFPFY